MSGGGFYNLCEIIKGGNYDAESDDEVNKCNGDHYQESSEASGNEKNQIIMIKIKEINLTIKGKKKIYLLVLEELSGLASSLMHGR